MAGRAGVTIDLDLSTHQPHHAGARQPAPGGEVLMEDFHDAGGLPAVLWRLRDLLKLDCLTVNGRTLGDDIKDAPGPNEEVHPHPREAALHFGAARSSCAATSRRTAR